MTDKRMLIGSLSNDLQRVAALAHRGSEKAALRFWQESKKWSKELADYDLKDYIGNLVQDLQNDDSNEISVAKAEKLLMYSILLQNYALHTK